MKQKLSYNTQHYFANNIKFIGIIIIVVGLVAFAIKAFLVSIVLLLISAFIFSAQYGIQIDLVKNEVFDYLSILGYRKGTKLEFERIEMVYITESVRKTQMQLRAVSNVHSAKEYNGYLKLSDDQKIHLLSSTNKNTVKNLLTKMSKELNVDCQDLSDN